MSTDKHPTFFQILALILSLCGLAFGLFTIYDIITPSPSGEWSGITVIASAVIDIPLGLISLIIAYNVKTGNSSLRRYCIIISVIVLCIPFVVNLLHSYHIKLRL